ncbi:hypothetical protein AVEN_256464-1 [Araneus ventricosus]|uniref:Uncharacterized protein n=1 Tax=Araneus ventricosus TaxID=182803 RepID=A0A4Y2GZS9_ARAVE|nr:hypothetical protein AVEN_256464-1 [Araneus ventricosus]
MLGIQDCATVIESNGSKSKISKRIILCNLKEAYKHFKDKFPSIKIGFSKFAELRRKRILAGESGTHSVCVCTTWQNIKLMIENAKLNTVTNDKIKNCKQCLAKVLCNPSVIGCNMGNCAYCPGETELQTILQDSFAENLIEQVQFRQWISVDRCNLEILEKSSEEFDLFCSKLSSLVWHDFIAKQQGAEKKISKNQLVVACDFPENYSIVLHDEAQSYHWTNQQVTIHPFVIYFKQENKVEHGWEKKVSKSPDKLKIEDISGYVTAVYEGNRWLGYVLKKNEELDEVKITFLHPFGHLHHSHVQETPMFCGCP